MVLPLFLVDKFHYADVKNIYYFHATSRRIRTVKKSCDTSTVRFVCGMGKFSWKNRRKKYRNIRERQSILDRVGERGPAQGTGEG